MSFETLDFLTDAYSLCNSSSGPIARLPVEPGTDEVRGLEQLHLEFTPLD